MDQQQYRELVNMTGQSIMSQGKTERLVHLIIIAIILLGTIYFSNLYWSNLTIPLTTAIGVICIIYELKSHEMITQASLAIIVASIEGVQRVKKWN